MAYHASPSPATAPLARAQVPQVAAAAILPATTRGIVRYYRHDSLVTGWEVKSELPGRLRLKNPVLFRKKALCQAHRARADGRAGDRPVLDQLDHRARSRCDYDPGS